MADAEARSGDHTELVVDMRNTTDGAMALVFRPGCSFEVLVYDQDGKVANQEYGGIIGGVCGAGSAIAVTLPAGGILRKRIDWEVRKERLECRDDDVCTIVPGSPIAPARYRIEVSTPFSDPVDGNPQHRRARRATATLVVTD